MFEGVVDKWAKEHTFFILTTIDNEDDVFIYIDNDEAEYIVYLLFLW